MVSTCWGSSKASHPLTKTLSKKTRTPLFSRSNKWGLNSRWSMRILSTLRSTLLPWPSILDPWWSYNRPNSKKKNSSKSRMSTITSTIRPDWNMKKRIRHLLGSVLSNSSINKEWQTKYKIMRLPLRWVRLRTWEARWMEPSFPRIGKWLGLILTKYPQDLTSLHKYPQIYCGLHNRVNQIRRVIYEWYELNVFIYILYYNLNFNI